MSIVTPGNVYETKGLEAKSLISLYPTNGTLQRLFLNPNQIDVVIKVFLFHEFSAKVTSGLGEGPYLNCIKRYVGWNGVYSSHKTYEPCCLALNRHVKAQGL